MPVFEPGAVLANKYRVLRLIGEGGMGVVFAAEDLHLPRRVAIKLMKNTATPEALERFLREGRALAQLSSEHVTRVFDVGSLDGGEPYLVMELLEGVDLSTLRKQRGRLPVEEAVDYVLQACVGVAEAHLEGFVHRDIKPANLFLATLKDHQRVVKVLDFGISKANERAKGPVTALTESGAMLGSPRFMSPEQLKSTRDVDARTDVWSLGATLYQLVTGMYAFDGESMAELVMEILGGTPRPLSTTDVDVPKALEPVIMRALAIEPDARFASVAELAAALADFAGDRGAYWLGRIEALYRAKGMTAPRPVAVTTVGVNPTVGMTRPIAVEAVPKPRSPVPLVVAAVLGGVVLVATLVVGGWVWSGSDTAPTETADSASSGKTKKKKKKKSGSKSKAGSKSGSKSKASPKASPAEQASRTVRELGDDARFFEHAATLSGAVKQAHGRPLRYYDVTVYADRARFVVEAERGLVTFEVTRDGVGAAKKFELSDSGHIDSVTLDEAALDVSVVKRIAEHAGGGVYSVGLFRDGKGLSWQATHADGKVSAYDLKGAPRAR